MKKILCLLLALVLSIGLCGCGELSSMVEDYLPDMEGVFDGGNLFGGDKEGGVMQNPAHQDEILNDTPSQDAPEAEVQEEGFAILPDFSYQPISSVTEWLLEAGVAAMFEYDYSDDVPEDCVMSQSIAAGKPYTGKEVLTITFSKGSENVPCPYEYSQKLTVTAAKGATNAKATLYAWGKNGWEQVAVYNAVVGKNGIGEAAEGSRRTPQGIHKMGVVLSSNGVSTELPTYMVSGNTCVIDDKTSRYYNIIMEKSQVPSGTSYDQIGKSLTNGTTYATIFIEHNGNGFTAENVVPGKGSAIGIRGQYGALKATYGDVDISYMDMIDLLSRLEADRNPVIEIVLQ